MMNEIPAFAAHHRASDDKWQTLESHLLGVADLASQFAAKLQLSKQGELLGLLHDLGKYSIEFQNYLKSATGALTNQSEIKATHCELDADAWSPIGYEKRWQNA